MRRTIRVPAAELADHIGESVVGYGTLTQAGVVQPGGDLVVAVFGVETDRREKSFTPAQLVELEVSDQPGRSTATSGSTTPAVRLNRSARS